MINRYTCGSNAIIDKNGSLLFLIETDKVENTSKWLFDNVRQYSIEKHECEIVGNDIDRKNHHLAHAYSAYFQSNFNDASILAIDGMNRYDGISIGIYTAENGTINEIKTYPTKYSLGSLYSFSTTICGFPNIHHTGKMMGASSYYNRPIDHEPFFLVDKNTGEITESNVEIHMCIPKDVSPDEFEKNINFINPEMTTETAANLYKFLGIDIDIVNNEINTHSFKNSFDFTKIKLAAICQHCFEQSVFSLLDYMHNTLPSKNLIISGGCGLNCVCNGKIIRSGKWDNLFIPNMCDDAGNTIGRLIIEYNTKINKPFIYNKVTYPIPKEYNKEISKKEISNYIKQGKIIAWFEGGSEYGPRALCHRSLLADPTLNFVAYRLNEIKHREYWRPLAPVVLDTYFKTFFDVDGRIWPPHKTMLATEYVKSEWQRKLQAICAPDNSSRPQVLSDIKENHTLYTLMANYDLPILVNTSMNDAGESICETPEDAIKFCDKNEDVILVFVKNDKLYVK